MKIYLLTLLVIFSLSCNSNIRNTEFKPSYDGIGLRWTYQYIEAIFKNSPADRVELKDKIQKGDILIALKKNNGEFKHFKDISSKEFNDLIRGKIGDIIYLKLNRSLDGKIIKEWTVALPVSPITLEGNDLKEAKYYHLKGFDNEYFYNPHTYEDVNKKWKEFGEKYFNIYLNERPSNIANDAIQYAFMCWGNSESIDKVKEAVKLLPYDDDVWFEIRNYIFSGFSRTADKKIISQNVEWADNLTQKVKSPKGKTALLYSLGSDYFHLKEKEKAIKTYNEILILNADKWYVERSKVYLHALHNLNIGQPAPKFCINDSNKNELCLDKLKGKFVLIHFWSAHCGFSKAQNKYLMEVYNKYNNLENFTMIGVSTDRDDEKTKEVIAKEKFLWPQIFQNFETKNNLLNLYGVTGTPQMYLLDTEGKIVYKDLRDKDLVDKVSKVLKK